MPARHCGTALRLDPDTLGATPSVIWGAPVPVKESDELEPDDALITRRNYTVASALYQRF
jgi:hypothetical protein